MTRPASGPRRLRPLTAPRGRSDDSPRRHHRRRRRARRSAPLRRVDRRLEVLRHAITVAGAVGVAYFVTEAVVALAGETTAARIAVRFLANVEISEALAWLFGASGIGFGYAQRSMRQRARRQDQETWRRLQQEARDSTSRGDSA